MTVVYYLKYYDLFWVVFFVKHPVDIKNRTYYCFNDLMNIKNFNPNNIKIDETLYKNILIYYVVYVTIKELEKIYSVNL